MLTNLVVASPHEMPVHRKESILAERVQALTLHSVGKTTAEIEAKTGIRHKAFKQLLRKAKGRGYIAGWAKILLIA